MRSIASVYAYDRRGYCVHDRALEAYKRTLTIFLAVFRNDSISPARRASRGRGHREELGEESSDDDSGGGGGDGGSGGNRDMRRIVANILDEMAAIYTQQRRPEEALDALSVALEIHESAEGKQHPLTVMTMYNMTMLFDSMVGRGGYHNESSVLVGGEVRLFKI